MAGTGAGYDWYSCLGPHLLLAAMIQWPKLVAVCNNIHLWLTLIASTSEATKKYLYLLFSFDAQKFLCCNIPGIQYASNLNIDYRYLEWVLINYSLAHDHHVICWSSEPQQPIIFKMKSCHQYCESLSVSPWAAKPCKDLCNTLG